MILSCNHLRLYIIQILFRVLLVEHGSDLWSQCICINEQTNSSSYMCVCDHIQIMQMYFPFICKWMQMRVAFDLHLYYAVEFIQRSYKSGVFVCLSVCPSVCLSVCLSVRTITFERLRILEFWLHQSIGSDNGSDEFEDGLPSITGSRSNVKGHHFFKWQHTACGVSFNWK